MFMFSPVGALHAALSVNKYAAVFVIHTNRLVTHGSIHKWVVVRHAVIVGGRICDNAHEEGDQRGIIHQGKQEGRVDREHGDGALGGNNGGGWGLHTFLVEFYSAGMADTANPQRIVRNSRKIGTRKQRTKTWWEDKASYRQLGRY